MIIILMGVAGSGKSTIGQLLAGRLGWLFFDGDQFHSPTNIAKMSRGVPLNDADRSDWLAAIADRLRALIDQDQSAVFACSALKEKYRAQLRVSERVRFVYLRGNYDLIQSRLAQRSDHYMKPALLASQFEALEEPHDALTVDIDVPPGQIVAAIVEGMRM